MNDPIPTPDFSTQPRPHRGWQGRLLGLLVGCVVIPLAAVHRVAFWFDKLLFPKLDKVHVSRPLFIVGVPRSGTTLFHRLLASQRDRFTTMPLWELILAPALCEKYLIWGCYRCDQLLSGRSERGPAERVIHWISARLSGSLDGVHATDLCSPEEDYLALIPFDGCFLRVLLWPYAKSTWQLGCFWPSNRQRRQCLLRRYRSMLQRHLRFRGEHLHILSKNPSLTAWLPHLAEEFEDACMLGLRRIPEESLPSQLSSLRGGLEPMGYRTNEPLLVQNFTQLFKHYWRVLDRSQKELDGRRFRLIEYQELMEDPVAWVRICLHQFGYSVSDSDAQRLDAMRSSVTGYRSRHHYSLQEFGLTQKQIHESFYDEDVSLSSPREVRSTVACR